MILAATRDAARLFLELGTVTVVLAVGARLAARTGFSSIPLYLIAGIVLGALAPPTLDDVLVTTLSEVGIVLFLFTLGLEYSALELASGLRSGVRGGIFDLALNFPPGFVVGLLMGWGLVGALVLGGTADGGGQGAAGLTGYPAGSGARDPIKRGSLAKLGAP
ncbi:MAG TPA: cation:proton antiporter [Candidatus Limnocylindria bacterium]|nr:cation:proton antiporter [Candidatus Limnocylindria bacterium]